MSEKLTERLAYKLVIVFLFIIICYLVNFNTVTSKLYENEITEYQNRIQTEEEYKLELIDTMKKLINRNALDSSNYNQNQF